MITPASFRADMVEFSSVVNYPDAMIALWISLANIMLVPERWGGPGSDPAVSPPVALIDFGYEFFVAHNLVLEKQAIDAGRAGGAPVGPAGPVASKAVGPISKSYDTSAGLVLDSGAYNLTSYGIRFIQLARMAGAGGLTLSGSPYGYGAPWAGPLTALTGLSN